MGQVLACKEMVGCKGARQSSVAAQTAWRWSPPQLQAVDIRSMEIGPRMAIESTQTNLSTWHVGIPWYPRLFAHQYMNFKWFRKLCVSVCDLPDLRLQANDQSSCFNSPKLFGNGAHRYALRLGLEGNYHTISISLISNTSWQHFRIFTPIYSKSRCSESN